MYCFLLFVIKYYCLISKEGLYRCDYLSTVSDFINIKKSFELKQIHKANNLYIIITIQYVGSTIKKKRLSSSKR